MNQLISCVNPIRNPIQNPYIIQKNPISGIQDGESAGYAIYATIATASMAASVYHGYKRNNSIGWALVWGLMGGLFPVVTPVIAMAQGFGKPK